MTIFGIDHPFSQPLDELTPEELDKRFNDIMSRFNAARRMQMDPNILHQLDLLLTSIELEKERRATLDDGKNGVIIDTDPIEIPKFKGM
jgi:hypothetical protein